MLDWLRQQAGERGWLSYRDFTAAALYAPEIGYYARGGRARVGRKREADFYTASSLGGGVFGTLVRAAGTALIAPDSPAQYELVEIAAEPGGGIFGESPGPFAGIRCLRLGDTLAPPSRAVVFANEWLDAQPFLRLVFRRGAWRELGVRIEGDLLTEIELPSLTAAAGSLLPELPPETAEDYHVDISLDAEQMLARLCAQPWHGAIMLADYGHDWATLARERPGGTARGYYRHELTADLLARPGEQDLTCHVCWDRLEKILRGHGFTNVGVERQEAFLMRLAAGEIERVMAESPGGFSPARQTLSELLHPAHLGHKFQVLSARRV